jgi:hypothetical protein
VKRGEHWDRFCRALLDLLHSDFRRRPLLEGGQQIASDVADMLSEWLDAAIQAAIDARQCPACGRIAKRGATVVVRDGVSWCPRCAPESSLPETRWDPERVWITQTCVMDVITSEWQAAKPPSDDRRFRSSEYVRADVVERLLKEAAGK